MILIYNSFNNLFKCIIFIFFSLFLTSVYSKNVNYIESSYEFNYCLNKIEHGDVLVLKSGVYVGNFNLDKSIDVSSDGFVVITSNNNNNIFNITSKGIKINGLIFYNSGKYLDKKDACVYVHEDSESSCILDNIFSECGFGVWLNGSSFNYIFKNIFIGSLNDVLSTRGNTIHIYKNNNTIVSDNFIINGRDGIYISNSQEVSISSNMFINVRFGIHYMFSNKCNVISNIITESLIGTAIMYSKYVDLINNLIYSNVDHGLFFRDVLYSRILVNKSLYNIDGIYLGSSYYNDIINNDIIKNNIGIKVSNGSNGNLVYYNNIISNRLQVQFLDYKTIIWNSRDSGNYWSHYIGWDLNMDNIGDKKFYITSFSDKLVSSYPILRVMFNSPGLVLLQKIENQFPAFRKSSIIDNYPLMRPIVW